MLISRGLGVDATLRNVCFLPPAYSYVRETSATYNTHTHNGKQGTAHRGLAPSSSHRQGRLILREIDPYNAPTDPAKPHVAYLKFGFQGVKIPSR